MARSDLYRGKPGIASNYIHHFAEYARSHLWPKVMLYLRVSTREQYRKGNFDDQGAWCRKVLKGFGAVLVRMPYEEYVSGVCGKVDRWGLRYAAEWARKLGAVLVAESTDRLIRNALWTTENPDAWPTEDEFEDLFLITKGVPLATLLPPDMPWKEVRAHQSNRKAKLTPPMLRTPGYKKASRIINQPKAIEMAADGMSLRQICAQLNVPLPTVHRWIKS